ncbi:ArnT family glycosyltransferase [Patescibacteria group bacterium]
MNKKTVFFLIIILFIGSFFRLWQLDSVPPGLYPDEAINGNNAREALETGNYKWFYLDNNGREGLYINTIALSLKFFGNEPWAIRLVSTIFGILTILGLFLLTRKLFNDRIALFSSFFLAISFWHIIFSRIGFRAIMAPFFLVWAFYFLYSKRAVLAGLLFGLGFHSYIGYRIAPLILAIPFWHLWKQKQKKIIIIFLISTFIAGLPLGWYFLNNPSDFFGRTSQISIFSSESPLQNLGINIAKTFQMFFFIGDSNWRHNFSGAPQLWWPVAILFLIGFILSMKRKSWFVLSWFIIMFLPVVVSNEGIPHALRAIILIPPVMIFAGIGMNYIYKKIPKKFLPITLLIFFSIITLQTYNQYFQKWAQSTHTYHAFTGKYWDLGQELKTLPSSMTKKYVIVNVDGVLVNGVPMPAQTVMFSTNNDPDIIYILPEEVDSIRQPANCPPDSCIIIKLNNE